MLSNSNTLTKNHTSCCLFSIVAETLRNTDLTVMATNGDLASSGGVGDESGQGQNAVIQPEAPNPNLGVLKSSSTSSASSKDAVVTANGTSNGKPASGIAGDGASLEESNRTVKTPPSSKPQVTPADTNNNSFRKSNAFQQIRVNSKLVFYDCFQTPE